MAKRVRVTRVDLDRAAERLSLRLNGLAVFVEERNGYVALDLYDRGGCVKNLTVERTKGDMARYLVCMNDTLDLVRDPSETYDLIPRA